MTTFRIDENGIKVEVPPQPPSIKYAKFREDHPPFWPGEKLFVVAEGEVVRLFKNRKDAERYRHSKFEMAWARWGYTFGDPRPDIYYTIREIPVMP